MPKNTLHQIVKNDGLDPGAKKQQITLLLSRKQSVKVQNAGSSAARPRVVFIDHEAIWKGLEIQQTTYTNVTFDSEEGKEFQERSEDARRLCTMPLGRVQRIDQGPIGARSYPPVIDVKFPADPDQRDKNGETALYVASSRSPRDDIITLVELYADLDGQSQTKVFDASTGQFTQVPGGSPLVAAIDAANIENVKLLLTLGGSPEKRIQAVGSDGKLRTMTPLAYAADKALEEDESLMSVQDVKAAIGVAEENPWEEIRALVAEPCKTISEFLGDSRNASLARVQNLNGLYPLHTVCARGGEADLKVVTETIANYPAAVALTTQAGELPLHLALREGSQAPEVIKLLMELPDGWKRGFIEDNEADPVAVSYENPMDSAEDYPVGANDDDNEEFEDPGGDSEDPDHPFNARLLQSLEGGRLAEVKDAYGCLPLHLALRNSSDAVVLAVLEQYPEAAKLLDGDGDSCLRLALTRVSTAAADSPGAAQRIAPPQDDEEDDFKEEIDVEDRDKTILEQLGDADNDGILDAEEQEALRDQTSIARKVTAQAVVNPLSKVVGTLNEAISLGAKTVGGVAAMVGFVQEGDEIEHRLEPDVGARVEARGVEVIKALVDADPDALTRKDVDGRTALQLAVELDLPAEQFRVILLHNKAAAQEPYIRKRLTLSLTIPNDLSDDRQMVARLANHHCLHQRVPKSMRPGQIVRRKALIDATVIQAAISQELEGGDEFTHTLNSGQKLKLTVPKETSQLKAHPDKRNHWVHPFRIGNIEEFDYFMPPGSKAGTEDRVYTQCGSRVKITTPMRRNRGLPTPLLIRPRQADSPDNVEYAIHRAILNNQPDLVIMLALAYPEAVSKPNRYGMLPLHLHMIDGSAATAGSVTALLDAYGEAASIKSQHGDLPLHILLQNGGKGDADPEVAKIVMEKYPAALTTTDSLGRYPLHSALIKFRMDSFILAALETSLDGESPAKKRTPDGDLPLHLALENHSSREVIQALVDANPDAITLVRTDGTSNLQTAYINSDRRHVDLTSFQINQMAETIEIFFASNSDVLTDPRLSDPKHHKDLCIHHALTHRSVDKIVLTTVNAIHRVGGAKLLTEQLLALFMDDSEQGFALMIEQNRGKELITTCLQLCEDGAKELLNSKNPDGLYPIQVLMEHCTRPDVARAMLAEHARQNAKHKPTEEERLFLAARTGDVDTIHEFVRSQNVDFNAQNDRGLTAKEVASKHGHHRCANALPRATAAALSKDAMVRDIVQHGGNARMANYKFQLAPYIAVMGFFLYYLDVLTDVSLVLKFGNLHFPPFNQKCEIAFEEDPGFDGVCSQYREPQFFYMSASILILGAVCTCIVDYFMLHSTETGYRLGLNWLMNLLYIRMIYEVTMAVRNRTKGRMPQAGPAAVKAAEGLFESVPQLLLQGFIFFRLYLEPIRPVDESWPADYGTIDASGRRVLEADNITCAASYTSWTELMVTADNPKRMRPPDGCVQFAWDSKGLDESLISKLSNTSTCPTDSPYHHDNFCICPMMQLSEDQQCVSSYDMWWVLARSIAIGLCSVSTSVAMLPETVRGQWRVAFALYILCQILFRVFSFTMALTVATLTDQIHIFVVAFILLYVIQAFISVPKRVQIVNDVVKKRSAQQLRKEMVLAKKQQRTKLMTEYTVIEKQPLQARKELDSEFIRMRSKKNPDEWLIKHVMPGNQIRTIESGWLPNGKQRVQLKAGWLSVTNDAGKPLLKVRQRHNATTQAGEVVASPQEKLWIGMLTVIVPVQFDTIKNLHKSNPSQETTLSFALRVTFNIAMTVPFIYFLAIFEKDPIPYTYKDIEASPLTEGILSKVWQERISISRAQILLQVTYVFGVLSFLTFYLTNSIERVHSEADSDDEDQSE